MSLLAPVEYVQRFIRDIDKRNDYRTGIIKTLAVVYQNFPQFLQGGARQQKTVAILSKAGILKAQPAATVEKRVR